MRAKLELLVEERGAYLSARPRRTLVAFVLYTAYKVNAFRGQRVRLSLDGVFVKKLREQEIGLTVYERLQTHWI